MKDHEIAQFINELRDTAMRCTIHQQHTGVHDSVDKVKFEYAQQLRSRLHRVVYKYLRPKSPEPEREIQR